MANLKHDKLYQILGAKIASFRSEKNITQTAFAKQISLSRASVVNIERGRQRPPLHLIWEIAVHLDVELEDLLPDLLEIQMDSEEEKLIVEAKKQVDVNKKTEKKLTQFIKDL